MDFNDTLTADNPILGLNTILGTIIFFVLLVGGIMLLVLLIKYLRLKIKLMQKEVEN